MNVGMKVEEALQYTMNALRDMNPEKTKMVNENETKRKTKNPNLSSTNKGSRV